MKVILVKTAVKKMVYNLNVKIVENLLTINILKILKLVETLLRETIRKPMKKEKNLYMSLENKDALYAENKNNVLLIFII